MNMKSAVINGIIALERGEEASDMLVSYAKGFRRRACASVRMLLLAAAGLSAAWAFAAEGVSFAHRPLLAGKASLTSDGFEVSRTLGIAAIAPELRMPVELVYDSSSESSGAFGRGWRSPQLESSVRWERDGLLWTTPWGEKVKFFPKKEKTS